MFLGTVHHGLLDYFAQTNDDLAVYEQTRITSCTCFCFTHALYVIRNAMEWYFTQLQVAIPVMLRPVRNVIRQVQQVGHNTRLFWVPRSRSSIDKCPVAVTLIWHLEYKFDTVFNVQWLNIYVTGSEWKRVIEIVFTSKIVMMSKEI